ncbi:MAG: disulfide bond formation protein B [Geminicoccaceae bacterium]
MSDKALALGGMAVAAIAALSLAIALAFQYLGGAVPCELCITERWAYVATIVAVGLGVALGRMRLGLVLAALTLLANVVISGFHVGVEEGVFALPQSCNALGKADTLEALKAQLETAPLPCDQVTVSFLGLSLATWNLILAILLTIATVVMLVWPRSAAEQNGNRRGA